SGCGAGNREVWAWSFVSPSEFLIRSSGSYCEAFLERIHGRLDFRLDAVVERFLRRNVLQQGWIIRFGELQELALETLHLTHRHSIESPARAHLNHQYLFFRRQRHVLILLQNLRQPLSSGKLALRHLVELIRAELRERRQLAV